PDGVMEDERPVTLAPRIAGAGILLEDDGRHAEAFQPRAEGDAALAAADDHRIGLSRGAEGGLLRPPALEPGPAVRHRAMLDAAPARLAAAFFVSLELSHRRQERDAAVGREPHMAPAARDRRLEGEPAFGYPAGRGGFAFDLPGRGLDIRQRGG